MSHAETHNLDVDFEKARSVHRIVRAMHDGECPKCHSLHRSDTMRREYPTFGGGFSLPRRGFDMTCPLCGFTITSAEQEAAVALFAPAMDKNLALFEEWRASLPTPPAEEPGGGQP